MKSWGVAWFLAVKSVSRGNIRVLLLTIAMLILVYLNLVFTPAILAGAVEGLNDKTINTLTGHIIVQSAGGNPVITDVDSLIAEIESIDGVVAACARNNLGADVQYEGERTTTVVFAIDPDQDKDVFRISESLVEGSYLEIGR